MVTRVAAILARVLTGPPRCTYLGCRQRPDHGVTLRWTDQQFQPWRVCAHHGDVLRAEAAAYAARPARAAA